MTTERERLLQHRDEAETKALDSLARYKFAMFGYWAGIWVHLNRIIGDRRASPFHDVVQATRKIIHDRKEGAK